MGYIVSTPTITRRLSNTPETYLISPRTPGINLKFISIFAPAKIKSKIIKTNGFQGRDFEKTDIRYRQPPGRG